MWSDEVDDVAYELAKQSDLFIVAIDADARKVEMARRKLDAAGVYGSRVTVLQADPATGGNSWTHSASNSCATRLECLAHPRSTWASDWKPLARTGVVVLAHERGRQSDRDRRGLAPSL